MLRVVALLLTVVTGFTGLVYEITWEKLLATLLGSHAEATATVLGLFLGGLALGYAVFGRLTRGRVARAAATGKPPRLLVVYGILEASIGAYALILPILFRGAQTLSPLLPGGAGGLGFAFDVALSALLIGPPAVLMGGTIPMLTQALSRSLADATRFHALVYGFNTLGAFAGALAAGFWLVPTVGLIGTLLAVGCVNLGVGGVFVLLGRRSPGEVPAQAAVSRSTASIAPRAELARYAAVALLAGFAMMTVQTSLIRLGALSFGASQFTFSMVVAVFVLCIALGSLAVSALPVSAILRLPRALLPINLWLLTILLSLLYGALENSPYWAHALRSLFRDQAAGFYPYHVAVFLGVLLVIGPAVALSGATLPLLFDRLRRDHGDLGHAAGRLYSWNTVGSLLGALLGGYALLFWLDLHAVFRLALAALVLASGLASGLATADFDRRGRIAIGLVVAAALGTIAVLPAWEPDRLASGLFRNRTSSAATYQGPDAFFEQWGGRRVIFYEDDPTASIAAKQWRLPDGRIERAIVTNGKPDAAVLQEVVTMALAGLLPALMAEKAERAFVVGYGTGVSAGALAALDSMREVLVAEISSGVIHAAPLFEYANLEAAANPKLRIVRADAYRALMRSDGRFDVITSVPSNPWVSGIEMLYSREFLEAARDHLSPGGVHAQWFHVYETNGAAIATVFRNFAAVYEHVAVWYGKGADLILLGMSDPATALDLERLAARVRRPDFAAGLARCDIDGLPRLLAHELLPLGVLHATRLPGEIHTLLKPRLGYLAARGFFAGRQGRLPVTAGLEPATVGRRNSLLLRHAARHGGTLPPAEREAVVSETCRYRPVECVTSLASWAHDGSDPEGRRRVEAQVLRDPTVAGVTPLNLVEPLAQLFGDEAPRTGLRNSFAAALQTTDRFTEYYHHAAPFSRKALAAAWRHCATDARLERRCGAAQAQAEATLGDTF